MQDSTHTASWYAASFGAFPQYPQLQGEHRTEVAVIGGGFTGLSAALTLAEAGIPVTVLEGARIGWAASGRNGGQINSAYARSQEDVARATGPEDALLLWSLAEEAKALLRSRAAHYKIDAHIVDGHLSVAEKPGQMKDLRAVHDEWQEYGLAGVRLLDRDETQAAVAGPRFIGGLLDPTGGHLNPLRLAIGLADAAAGTGALIFERSKVVRLDDEADGVKLTTLGGGVVHARHVLLAGNAMLGRLEPRLAGRIMAVDTGIIATAPLAEGGDAAIIPSNWAVTDSFFVLSYFRRSDDGRILFGGGVNYTGRPLPGDRLKLIRRMNALLPGTKGVEVTHHWSGLVDISMNRLPQIGRLSPRLWYAQGFSGHGVALTQMAGHVIAEAIRGQTERFDLVSRIRHRAFPGGPLMRRPLLMLGTTWARLQDLLA